MALSNLGPDGRGTLAKAHIPGMSSVFVDSVGSGSSPNGLTIVESGQDASDKGGRLFQMVEEGAVVIASVVTTGLALPVLDGAIFAVVAICDDGVDGRIGDSKVRTERIGAVMALTVDGFGASATSFDL